MNTTPANKALTDNTAYLQGRADGLDEAILHAMAGLTVDQITQSTLIAHLSERRRIALAELHAATDARKQVA